MSVDVTTEIEIGRPVHEVWAYAADPDNAVSWYAKIESVEWKTAKPIAIGSKVAFVARFLHRRLAYTYEVTELVAGRRLVMRTAQGPFPMETVYTWHETEPGATRMTIRNRGEPSGFSRVSAPVLARAISRANKRDLRRIKEILESRSRR